MITQKRLKNTLYYNRCTGKFIWIVNIGSRAKKYNTAGTPMADGRIVIRIDKILYYAHQLAWLYVYGVWPNHLDHKDTNNQHNWIDNLRESTKSQNGMNTKLRKDNSTGYRGVYYNKINKNYNAYININGRRISLGTFITAEDASNVYEQNAIIHFGAFKCMSQKQEGTNDKTNRKT